MRTIKGKQPLIARLTLAAVMGDLLQAPAALAAGGWRPTYDTIMMWVNFAILVTVLIKLLRQPLGNFLTAQQDAVKDMVARLEGEKGRIGKEIQALRATLANRQQQAADRHQRLLAAGEEERRALIAEARREAQRRLRKARQMIEAHYRDACRNLRDDMIDSAVRHALTELPKHITPEVEQILTERFLQSISGYYDR